jgi:TolB-like protein/tetratricopeptide (TPR) repeat protein
MSSEVWRAHDEELNRDVAIKRLQGEFVQDVLKEARFTAKLNHPNICTIYSAGNDYLVLEYVPGAPIRGPLPVSDAIKIGVQVAVALDAAHQQGIIHKDLKPTNILVTASGMIKVLDFGLATVMRTDDGTTASAVPGVIKGTLPYMSPEQVKGESLDFRSDIFSLGVVLYELVSGLRPFNGSSTAEVMAAIVRDEPAPITRSPELEHILSRCLQKVPAERFHSALDVKTALLDIEAGSGRRSHMNTIAVLPFRQGGGGAVDDAFADGLTDDIINTLARVPGLKITGQTSSYKLRGKEHEPRFIADTLNVRFLLEGTVQRLGSRVRVMPQLIDGATGLSFWSNRYDSELTDIFDVQDQISAVARELHVTLVESATAAEHGTRNALAYETWLNGRYHLRKHTPEEMEEGKILLEKALELDPTFCAPYLSLGRYYLGRAAEGLGSAAEMMPRVREYAERAHDLFPGDPRCNALLGITSMVLDRNWETAQKYFNMAMALPNPVPEVAQSYGFYVAGSGLYQDAADVLTLALSQDPLNVAIRGRLANYLNLAGIYQMAMDEAQKAIATERNYWLSYYVIAENYALRDMNEDGISAAHKAYELAPWNSRVLGLLCGLYARLGDKERTSELMKALRRMSPTGLMFYDLLSSDSDTAIASFRRALQERELFPILYAHSSLTRRLRAHPEWVGVIQLINPSGFRDSQR